MHSTALTARVITGDIDHKVTAMSWTVHDSTGLFESEQILRYEVK